MKSDDVSDQQLVASAADGEQSWNAFYARFAGRVEAIVRNILRDPRFANDVNDVCQDVFLAMLRYVLRHGATQPVRQPGPWVRRVATNAAIAFYRHQKSRGALASVAIEQLSEQGEEIPADAPTPYESLLPAEERRRFMELIEDLTLAQQAVLKLTFLDDLGSAEISAILGISENAVRINKHRALLRVRHAIEQANPGVGR